MNLNPALRKHQLEIHHDPDGNVEQLGEDEIGNFLEVDLGDLAWAKTPAKQPPKRKAEPRDKPRCRKSPSWT